MDKMYEFLPTLVLRHCHKLCESSKRIKASQATAATDRDTVIQEREKKGEEKEWSQTKKKEEEEGVKEAHDENITRVTWCLNNK